MWTFTVGRSRDQGWHLTLLDVPTWAYVAELAAGEVVCRGSGHLFCSPPEWTYRIGWGPRDEYGDFAPRRSVGSLMYRTISELMSLTNQRERRELTIPITAEQARDWDPRFVADLEELDGDDPDVSVDAARWTPGQ